MNLTLTWCHKEWRAQRGILLAYTLLVFACLCIGLSMAPTHYWMEEGFGTHALTWFVTAGVIGVVAFVAPALVRAEFHGKDDLFVRRLPGALWPSFAGKLLFFVLAALSLPLLGLAVGELFVRLHGYGWEQLWRWNWYGEVTFEWPALVIGCGFAMLLAPWIWAIGTWLPGGRMALGGTMLFVLLVGVAVAAVLRQSPRIEAGIEWRTWLWFVAPLGLAVAATSWGLGRRGGGALRSARVGLTAAAVGLVPPSVWFADRAWDYHHPDLQHLAELNVYGLSPDGRFALAFGRAHELWCNVPLRIDLQTGAAEQLGGIYSYLTPEILRPYLLTQSGQKRYWRFWDYHNDHRLFDLATGAWTPIGFDEQTNTPTLSPELHQRVLEEAQAATPLRLPGDRPVWMDEGWLCTTAADGGVRRIVAVERPGSVSPAGHAVRIHGQRASSIVDLQTGETLVEEGLWSHLVRDVLLFVPKGKSRGQVWEQRGGERRLCEPLAGCEVLGDVDDDRVLCARTNGKRRQGQQRLFLYRPADGDVAEITLPDGIPFESVQVVTPLSRWGSMIQRDPAGRVWLRCTAAQSEVFAKLDVAALQVTTELPISRSGRWYYQVIAWPDADSVVLLEGAQIVRVRLSTGERTVLFPRR